MELRIIRKNLLLALSVIGLLCFTFILYKIYIPRINEFGCFDDCNNFMGGYFMLQGKKLFSQIFFNHAPGMAYISYVIQFFSKPINVYELVLRHRQFVILFGLLANLLLLLRFRFKVIGVIIFFELSKFYLFGDRFLAEGLMVYPILYFAGVIWEISTKKKIYVLDYILCAFFSWLIIFTRETYIPLTLFLFLFLLTRKVEKKVKINAITFFIFLSGITLLLHNIPDLIYNVYTVNITLIQSESQSTHILGPGIFKAFLYPLFIPFTSMSSIMGHILITLALLFLIETVYFLHKKRYGLVAIVWIILGLANLRPVTPGKEFFDSFHMLIWYGLFLFFSFSFLFEIKIRKVYWLGLLTLTLLPILFLFSPNSYLRDKLDIHTSLIVNYGGPLQVGNVINTLAEPSDTLFLDGFDDIIYFVAGRHSDYSFSWYTSLMPNYSVYTDARIAMFHKHPPDFYYGSCIKEDRAQLMLPDFIKHQYIRLTTSGKPTCLWINTSKLPSITADQWRKANEMFYELPKEN